jgi:hypothetical protein
MMLVVQIALGIVLAVLILRYFGAIVAVGFARTTLRRKH